MTAEMPSTKPNIMMTARLLLMPVLKSVELKVVLWAKAETVLSANSAATVRSGRSRERIFGASVFFIGGCFVFVFFVDGRLCRPITRLHLPPKKKAKVQALNKMQSGSW